MTRCVTYVVAAALAGGIAILLARTAAAQSGAFAPHPSMNFFVTSVGLGDGANLGGMAGADYHCQQLAEAAGSPKTFYAYLSNRPGNGVVLIHARDRIGRGPWYNARGTLIARTVDELHQKGPLTKERALTEQGEMVELHDILTGTQPDGRAYSDTMDHTCNMYTSSGQGSIQVGHADRSNGSSWNSAHATKGCSQEHLKATGGAGLFYCFAID